jgi:protein SCO1
MNNFPSQSSLGIKLIYLVIILLWMAAAGAVYYTFFASGSEPVRESVAEKDGAVEHEGAEIPDEDSGEPRTLVINAKGEEVDPEESLLPRKLPEFEFVNQSHETVSLDSLKGKPWVATFVFTKCPGPCPMITGRMRVLQQDMKRFDFNLISITVDPERDTPEILSKYADAFSADRGNWHFLTGDRGEIYSLIQEGFKMPVGEIKPGDILHTNRFVMIDPEGNYIDSFLGMNDEEFAKLKKRLRELAARRDDSGADTPSADSDDDSATPSPERE